MQENEFMTWTIAEREKTMEKLAACWNFEGQAAGEIIAAIERQNCPAGIAMEAVEKIFAQQETLRKPSPKQLCDAARELAGSRFDGEKKLHCGLQFHPLTPEREALLATLRVYAANRACAYSEEYQCWYVVRPDGIEREVYEDWGSDKKPYKKFTPFNVLTTGCLDRLIRAIMENQDRQDLQARARPKSFEEFKARALGGKTNLAEKEIEWLQSKRSKDALIDVQEEPGADG